MSKLHYVFITIALTFLLTACMNQPENSKSSKDDVKVEQSSFQPDEVMTRGDIADHLTKLAERTPEVHDAASIVIGPYTVVGIDIDKNIQRKQSGTVKQTVVEALAKDPYGKQAVVIADADMPERLRGMRDALQGGAPVKGVLDELSTIVSRYVPALPTEDSRDTSDEHPNAKPDR